MPSLPSVKIFLAISPKNNAKQISKLFDLILLCLISLLCTKYAAQNSTLKNIAAMDLSFLNQRQYGSYMSCYTSLEKLEQVFISIFLT